MDKNDLPNPTAKQVSEDPKFVLERKRFRVEKITLVVLSVYAGIAAVQAYLMYRATTATESAAKVASDTLTNSRKQFLTEERPIVWITNELGSPVFVPNRVQKETGQIVWTVHYTNYGKTPTKDLKLAKSIKLGDQSFTSYGEADGEVGAPLPPGKNDMTTFISEPGISKAQFNKLLAEMAFHGVSISMRITYADAYGGDYETGVCLTKLNMGSIGYCLTGNYID
jgi:hypothetical protein